jgi:hypothetical protein
MIASLPDRHLRGAVGFSATVNGVPLPISGPGIAPPPTTGQSGGVFAPALGVPVGGNLVVTITGGAIDRDVLLNRADGNGAILIDQQIIGQADDNGNFTYSAPALPGIVYESWWLGGEPVGSYGYNGGGSGTVQPSYSVADYAKATGQPALPQQVYNTPIFVADSAVGPRFLGPPILSTASVSTPSSVTPDSLAPATTGPLFQGYSPVAVQSPVLTTQGGQTSPSPTVTSTPSTATDSGTTDTSTTVLLAAAALAAYFFMEG